VSLAGTPTAGPVVRYLSRLRFPWLFVVTAVLFVADIFLPDLVPFADEIILGLVTALLGSWRKQREDKRLEGTAANELGAEGDATWGAAAD